MRPLWYEIWESADGPVARLAPPTRLAVGTAMFAACMIAPSISVAGSLFIVITTAMWVMACRPKSKLVGAFLLLGLALFLPYFLLVPLIDSGNTHSIWMRLLVPWSIFIRGMGCLMVSTSTLASVSSNELREALVRLPVPNVVSAILVQIIQQTAVLVEETRCIASAMAVRNASSGYRVAWKVLFSLPRVWLPRVIDRAERVALAMELRGYDGLLSTGRIPVRFHDIITLTLALGAIGFAVALRLRSGS